VRQLPQAALAEDGRVTGAESMDQNRRAFLQDAGKFILLTGAATPAWD
jgi:hypothetical protein